MSFVVFRRRQWPTRRIDGLIELDLLLDETNERHRPIVIGLIQYLEVNL
jgi:hypothetical protein